MTSTAFATAGCFQASFPSKTWTEVKCATGTHPPQVPRAPGRVGHIGHQVVGDADNDFVSEVNSGRIAWSEGSFPIVKNLTSVNDTCANGDLNPENRTTFDPQI